MNTPDTNSTSNNSSNGTFGQSIIDNCLTPGITAEMQCVNYIFINFILKKYE